MTLRAHRHHLDAREPDAVGILRFMARIQAARQTEPYLREMAVEVLRAGMVGDHDQHSQAAALCDWVKEKVKYVLDPVGAEYIRDPVLMLDEIRRHGEARGDCDDHALLLVSLLGSIGLEARPAAVKIPEELPPGEDYFNHVIAQARIGGEWIDYDPCAKREAQRTYTEHLTLNPSGPVADTAQDVLETLGNIMHTMNQFGWATGCGPRGKHMQAFATGGAGLLNFFGATSFLDLAGKLVNLGQGVVSIISAFDDGDGGTVQLSNGQSFNAAQFMQMIQAAQAQQQQKPAEWIPGVPNAVVLIGGGVLILFATGALGGGRRR